MGAVCDLHEGSTHAYGALVRKPTEIRSLLNLRRRFKGNINHLALELDI